MFKQTATTSKLYGCMFKQTARTSKLK